MKSREIIEKFTELRALGNTYDEIKIELEVSKPTLVRWGKEFKEEIIKTRKALTKRLVQKIVEYNEDKIIDIAVELQKIFARKSSDEKGKQRFTGKKIMKLADIFGMNVKNIGWRTGKAGDIEFIKIDFFE